MKRRFIAACAVVAALSAAATGCVTNTTGAGAEPTTAPARAGQGRDLTRAERLRVSDATEVLTERCMNRAGFAYWPSTRLSLEESRSPGFVNDDVEWAAEHGYGSRIQEKAGRARQANPNGTYRASLAPQRRQAYDKALDGGRDATVLTAEIPTPAGTGRISRRLGGCSAQAEKELYGDPEAWFRAKKAVTNLQPLYVPRITRDKKFTDALAEWARCMAKAGYRYADPPAAQDAVAQRAAGLDPDEASEAFEAEKRVAVAEARCARESALGAVARERESYYRGTLPDRYGELIDTHRRLEREAYTRAARITGPRV
ncbi:hypothetical protein [Streptomyces sp. NBC_00385]|uniref:hypothetical protein n=1 Tax=Streptomyces sp. NBC_00385 TaxID=2975733 RepID=UPI002DDC8998|nr:hypothetical protein [Streptomyces sp. NBC_00385]WRZ05454.1 hypothetical protein OG959_19965 [Streptomyces sp. NBC_00385]